MEYIIVNITTPNDALVNKYFNLIVLKDAAYNSKTKNAMNKTMIYSYVLIPVLVENDGVRPPFNKIPGFGTVAAESLVEARKDGKFMSINDLKIRAKIGDKAIEVLKTTGCLQGMSQSNQLSLFDF